MEAGSFFPEANLNTLPAAAKPVLATVAPNLKAELGLTLRLGVPLALGELGWMSTYIVDALMIGRLHNSALPIAASSLGNTIFYAIAFCAIYLLNGLETLIAQAFGKGEEQECVHLLVQSFWIVVIASPLVMLSTLGVLRLLPFFGTPPDIAAEAGRYVHALIWSTLPLMAYMALRRFLQSINRVALISASLITASLVNFAFDWIFMFGKAGIPALGVAGSGWATCVVRLYMLLLLVAGTVLAFRRHGYELRPDMLAPDWPRLRALLKIGWPSSLQELEELGQSTYGSILCARLGATLLAAHQVVLDLNAFVYQVSAGLSYATIVRVGQSAGRNNLTQVKRATNASLLLGLGFMAVAGTLFATFSQRWASLYTNSPAVVAAAIPIFITCAFALMGDTLAVLLASAFTGLGETRVPFYVSLVWNCGIALPLMHLLAIRLGYSLVGLWWGRCVACVGTGLTMLVLWRLRLRRVERTPSLTSLSLLSSLPAAK